MKLRGLLTVLVLAGLGFAWRADALLALSPEVEVFAKTLHPVMLKKCAECHGDDGLEEAPPHSVSDPEAAYAKVSGYLNFQTPDKSKLVRYAENDHCKEYTNQKCGYGKGEFAPIVSSAVAEILEARKNIKSYQFAAKLLFPKFKEEKQITLSWDLLAGSKAKLLVDVILLDEMNPEVTPMYKFTNFRLAEMDKTYFLQGLSIDLNGTPLESQSGLRSAGVLIAPAKAGTSQLLALSTPVAIGAKINQDSIVLHVEEILDKNFRVCQKANAFNEALAPLLASAGELYDTSGANACQIVLGQMNESDIQRSVLWTNFYGAPGAINKYKKVVDQLREWLSQEYGN